MDKYVFVDLETTSTDPWRGDILEGCMILTDTEYEEKDRIIFKCKPQDDTEWDEEAFKIHNINFVDAQSYPSRREAALKVLLFLAKHEITQHNTKMVIQANPNKWVDKNGQWTTPNFDKRFLEEMFKKEQLNYALEKYFPLKVYNHKDTAENGTVLNLWYSLNYHGFKKKSLAEACRVAGFELTDHHNCQHDTLALLHCWRYFESMGVKFSNKADKQQRDMGSFL